MWSYFYYLACKQLYGNKKATLSVAFKILI